MGDGVVYWVIDWSYFCKTLFYNNKKMDRRRNMKQSKRCLVLTATVIALCAGTSFAAPEAVTLKVAHFLPPGSTFHQKNLIPWCDKIGKESGGRLKCQLYFHAVGRFTCSTFRPGP